MSSSIRFPAVGTLLAEGYSNTREETRTRVGMESGPARQRRRMLRSPRLFSVTWKLTTAEYLVFEDWLQGTLRGGEREFDVRLLDDTETFTWYTVRFIEQPEARIAASDSNEWRVSAKLRSKDPPFATRPAGTNELRGFSAPEFTGTGRPPVVHALRSTSLITAENTGRFSLPPLRGLSAPAFHGRGRPRLNFWGLASPGVTATGKFPDAPTSSGLIALGNASPYGLISADGITWSTGSGPTTAPVTLAFGAGVFVCTDTNTIYSSSNGTSWTARHTLTSSRISVIWDGARFVAITVNSTSGPRWATSTDGISWSSATTDLPTTYDAFDIAFDGTTYMVSMYNTSATGTITAYKSTDGVNWTATTAITSWSCATMTHGFGLFVQFNYGKDSTCRTSPDGVTWTSQSVLSTSFYTASITANGKIVGLALNGNVAYSSNGTSWSLVNIGSGTWTSITWDGLRFVACSLATNMIATSPDAITWTLRSATDLDLRVIRSKTEYIG